MTMKHCMRRIAGAAATLFGAALLLFALAQPAKADASVSGAAELSDALANAALTPAVSATITFSAPITTAVNLSVPSNVTIQLAGNTWTVQSSAVTLAGTISGGSLSLNGTAAAHAALIVSGGASYPTPAANTCGAVRKAVSLQLENAGNGTETVQSLAYTDGSIDTSGYIQASVTGGALTVYAKLDGGSTKEIESITTDAGVYRLGTANVTTLSREYAITYDLGGGALSASAVSNPTSYTASDASFTLSNPTLQGYTFKGWTGTGLSGDPADNLSVTLVYASLSGTLSFTANWELQQGAGIGGGSGSGLSGGSLGSLSTQDTDTADTADVETSAAAAAQQTDSAASSARVSRGSSATKVTFTDSVSAAMPTQESASGKASVPWGLILVCGGVVAVALISWLCVRGARRRRGAAEEE